VCTRFPLALPLFPLVPVSSPSLPTSSTMLLERTAASRLNAQRSLQSCKADGNTPSAPLPVSLIQLPEELLDHIVDIAVDGVEWGRPSRGASLLFQQAAPEAVRC